MTIRFMKRGQAMNYLDGLLARKASGIKVQRVKGMWQVTSS